MTMTTTKTRPCRPGDALAWGEANCGARYGVEVVDPDAHPESGTTTNHDVSVRLLVMVPARDAGLLPALRDENVSVLDERLSSGWGIYVWDTWRNKSRVVSGPAIAPMVGELIAMGDEALATIQSVYDRHQDSRSRQAAARQAAYAAWPVADDTE